MKRCFVTSQLDYEVVTFGSSVDALEFARSKPVHLILTSYLLPQIDGLHFISSVRVFNASVPIILIADAPVGTAALERGATAFLGREALWTELATQVNELRPAATEAVAA